MAFADKNDPSIGAKVILSLCLLAGILYPSLLIFGDAVSPEKIEGNPVRQILMLVCSLLYFLRFTIAMFVFVKRRIGWLEGGLVSFLFFMMFYLFVSSAGSHVEPIGAFDIIGVILFLTGSYVNFRSDFERFKWKKKHVGELYTRGLFKHSMHMNYFGDSIAYLGLALITLEPVCVLVSIGIIINFIFLQIPMLDRHLKKKYGIRFVEYANHTKKLIPLVY